MLKLRVQPIHPWTIGQTAAFPAFQLTSEATANCLQQSEASSQGVLNTAKAFQQMTSETLRKHPYHSDIHWYYPGKSLRVYLRATDWILSDKTALKRNRYQEEPGRPTRFCTPSQGVFVNFPGKRGMTLWLCDALCSKKICFWHDITRGAHLATGPGDCSCRLVLGTGPGDWFSWQSAKSVFAWILLCIHSRSSPTALKSGQNANFLQDSHWPTVPFLNVPCRQSCWKVVTHNAKHSTLDVGAFGTNDKAVLATIGAVTIMHKHMWTVGAAAAKNKWKNQWKGYCLFCAIFCKASRISRF